MNVQVVIPAAGLGTRLGSQGPKALVCLGKKPMLAVTLSRFLGADVKPPYIIVVPQEWFGVFEEALDVSGFLSSCQLVAGGEERQHSVANGLAALAEDTEYVVIHDAARPFITADLINASLQEAVSWGAATVAIPASDTILLGDSEEFLVDTPDRRLLWFCQTPQTFRVDVIRAAHHYAAEEGYRGTDDASLVRRMGGTVKLVKGISENYKITTPLDLALARQWLTQEG